MKKTGDATIHARIATIQREMARRLGLTDESKVAIEDALAHGAPLRVAAAAGGVTERSLSRWLADGHVVRRQLRVADPATDDAAADEERIQASLVGAIVRAALDGDWRAGAWVLERRWPERYARR